LAAFSIELNISQAQDTYQRLIDALPKGTDNMTAGLVIPSHTKTTPVSLKISNVRPNIRHVLRIVSEWSSAPQASVTFVPTSDTASLTIAFAYGPNNLYLYDALGNETHYNAVVTHYATMFLAEAQQITDYSWLPIKTIENAIASPLSYLLAIPFTGKYSAYIPSDLETLNILGNKLLSKNLLWGPGTDRGVREIFAAFSASNPVLHKMSNTGAPTSFLYRNEETFSGYEAHVWLPNRDIERWQTFIRYTDNLPQVFTLKQIEENEVYVQVGNKVHRHVFDFESIAANTVIDTSSQCFKDLFRLDLSMIKKMYITFCQASYPFDNQMPPLHSEADPLGVRNFTSFTLTGRFEQQFDEDNYIHDWVYEPIIGIIDGVNRFFALSETPASPYSIKLFSDGLLLGYLKDFRISTGDSFRANIYALNISPDPELLTIDVGDLRSFIGPVFHTMEIGDTDSVQFLATAVNQTLNEVLFVISEPPVTSGNARIHYVTPNVAANLYGGANQYGIEAGISGTSYTLTYPTPASSINYQLLVQYAEDPAGPPNTVDQPIYLVRNHTTLGATIEFSTPITAPNAQLHWWLIEGDISLERDTITLPSSISSLIIPFTSGPYFDRVCVLVSLWNTTALGDVSMPLVATHNVNTVSFTVKFSEPIDSANYRLDYVVFPAELGLNVLEIFIPPTPPQIIEAQYDTIYDQWANTSPIESVDGVTQTFTLAEPCEVPKAMYATLNGRLLTQGANEQYTVEGTTLRMNFLPQPSQTLWCVYPTGEPGSAWDQGRLAWNSHTGIGAYASGKIFHDDVVGAGDTLTLLGETFLGTATAEGQVYNPSHIVPADTLTFPNAGITLTGVTAALYDAPLQIGTILALNVALGAPGTITLPNHGIFGNTLVYLTGDDLPSGITQYQRYYIVNGTANTFELSLTYGGPGIAITSQGTGSFNLLKYALPMEFPCGVSRDADGAALTAAINRMLSAVYYASYLGNGVTTIKAFALTGTASNDPITSPGVSILVTLPISGDSSSYANEVQEITFPSVPTSGKFNLKYNDEVTADIPYNATAADVQDALYDLPSLTSVLVTGTVGTGFTVEFVAADGKKPHPLLTVDDTVVSFDATDITADTIYAFEHGLEHEQTVGAFSAGTLPSGLNGTDVYYVFDAPIAATYLSAGTTVMVTGADTTGYTVGTEVKVYGGSDAAVNGTYLVDSILSPTSFTYIADTAPIIMAGLLSYIDGNHIQLMTAPPTPAIVPLVDQGVGTHYLAANSLSDGVQITPLVTRLVEGYGDRFPVGVHKLHDSQALATALNANDVVRRSYQAYAVAGEITVTATHVGTAYNKSVDATGSLRSSGIGGGIDPVLPHTRPPALQPAKPFYYAEAPVVTLDGLATRRYTGYSGNSVAFDVQPESLQIPYIVSQVYPIDYHPLDDMIANKPCSYPKGVFTQGLQAVATEMECDAPQTGILAITTRGAPRQEEPAGAVDGINDTFDMDFTTCNAPNSLMVWIDGIFQPPTKYTYSVFSGHGRITFLTPPATGQLIWVWYIIGSDYCLLEYVEQLTGVTDGVNTAFGWSNAVVDQPSVLVFMQGLLSLQTVNYTVDVGNMSLTYVSAPPAGVSMWTHYNTGAVEAWRQDVVGVGDGVQDVWVLPTLVPTQLPNTKDSVILALDGFVQRQGVDFFVEIGVNGAPNGFITFATAPDVGREIEVAYLTRG